ncbi:MAG: hypothetical protein JW976_00335 [Syntrophaceae bacterium]|nr:hypothetical protein [Syntrophaceae bacterium]
MSEGRNTPCAEKEKASPTKIFQGMKDEISSLKNHFWFAGWLFTLGFAGVKGWSILWSLVIWPYYLGHALKSF